MTNNLKPELQNTTDKQLFKPSANQEKWLEVAIQSGTDVIDEIGKLSGIDESSYYRWRKEDGFIEWYDAEYSKGLKMNRWRLNAIGMKNAKRDHKYWQDMQKITGNLKEEKSGGIQINNFVPILGGATAKDVQSNNSDK
jgi:hypothetical protein